MKIEASSLTSPLTGSIAANGGARPQSAAGKPGGDSVSLSEKSSNLQALESAIKDTPAIDNTKIEAIKKALNEGNFSISSGRVADKMMDSAREMMAQQKV